jgi:hypothetical protein
MQPYYVAAKFLRRKLPYIFLLLGNARRGVWGQHAQPSKLDKMMRYLVFLRTIFDTSNKQLYTSSPFSRLPKDLDI